MPFYFGIQNSLVLLKAEVTFFTLTKLWTHLNVFREYFQFILKHILATTERHVRPIFPE
jgi:hypothetical protein